MTNKIFQALKQAYPQLGLSDEIMSSHANMLAGIGFVTDENLDKVVAMQKDYLQGLQKANDKRVSEAIIKAATKAESEKQDAIQKAVSDAVAKAIEDERKKATESKDDKEPDFIAQFRKELAEKDAILAKEREELNKKIEDLLSSGKKQDDALKALQAENDAMKTLQAKQKRDSFISETAKSLGIPEWRVNEGFVFADNADEDSIKTSLTTIANNIKTAGLQGNRGHILDDNTQVTKDEIDNIVNGLIK